MYCSSPTPQAPAPPPSQKNLNESTPPQGDEPTTPEKRKSQRANVNIATLNVNGYAALAKNMTGIEKWKRITVINSQLQTNPHSSTSIAFVINKALIAMRELEKVELISGRTLAIKFKWHKENDITLVNVYMPNDRGEHSTFWELVDTRSGPEEPKTVLQSERLVETHIPGQESLHIQSNQPQPENNVEAG
ncbi:hypothetical protein EI94DRAFT_1701163 [Lactarius quietus]|nr:hypothetical protein EI94DRAFT_1701163 [Lactarius quietus]